MIIEQHFVDMAHHICPGTKGDRVILYHPKSIEELLEFNRFIIAVDLLSDKEAVVDMFHIKDLMKFSVQL